MMLLLMYWVASSSPDQNTWGLLINSTQGTKHPCMWYIHKYWLSFTPKDETRCLSVIDLGSQNECIRTGAISGRVGRSTHQRSVPQKALVYGYIVEWQ